MTVAPATILVIGRTGQVASELRQATWPAGVTAACLGRETVDLARPEQVRREVAAARPSIVINAAAFTAVDEAETARDTAFAVNRDGPAALAEACDDGGATLIHLSTDYVFDGEKAAAYIETDPINPLSVYGASKAEGESAVRRRLAQHVILRTSWVYSPVGRNFVRTMLRLGAERERLEVVDDQQGCPTSAADIAKAIVTIADALLAGRADGFGTFHFCGDGSTSWYRFAREIFAGGERRGLKRPSVLAPISSDHYPSAVRRPRRAVLDCAKIRDAYGIAARPWPLALDECLDRLASTRSSLALPPRAG